MHNATVDDMSSELDKLGERSMMRDAVLLTASKWTRVHPDLIHSPLMKEAYLGTR